MGSFDNVIQLFNKRLLWQLTMLEILLAYQWAGKPTGENMWIRGKRLLAYEGRDCWHIFIYVNMWIRGY